MPYDRDKEQRIRERAYRIWEDEGKPRGKDKEHWERARAEIDEEDRITRGDQDLDMSELNSRAEKRRKVHARPDLRAAE